MTQYTRYAGKMAAAAKVWRERGGWNRLLWGAGGFALAAGAVLDRASPLALGLVCAAPPGWQAVWAAVGALAGYCFFWQEVQVWGWVLGGVLVVALAGRSYLSRIQPLLIPACAALVVSASGVVFLLAGLDETPIPVYLLRVALGAGAAGVFGAVQRRSDGVAGWLVRGIATFCLAQIMPWRYANLGYLAAGVLGVRAAFPGAVLAGLGLDLAGVSAVSMAGVLCLSVCLRFLGRPKWLWAAPGAIYCALCAATGQLQLQSVPALLAGGLLGQYLPTGLSLPAQPGSTAVSGAQVQMEKQALLLDSLSRALTAPSPPVDRRALLRIVAQGACDTCPERKGCKARQQVPGLPEQLLEQPGLQTHDLPAACRKQTRLLSQLRLAQEQLRRIRGQRLLQERYRQALQSQYRLMASRLRLLCDGLRRPQPPAAVHFQPRIAVVGRAVGEVSGDLCLSFTCGGYAYVLLCDGMGTGEAAARCSRSAGALVRQQLEAGICAEEALECYNTLCDLRAAPGECTLDLLQMDLRSGGCVLYKWGAAASVLVRDGQWKKVGTAVPPPGVSQQTRAAVERLSLGEEDLLLMLTDGAWEEGNLAPEALRWDACVEEAAQAVLDRVMRREDDATVAAVRLCRCRPQ